MSELKTRMEIAADAARQAGEFTLQYYQGEFEVERKADESPVTIADRGAEKWLEEFLRSHFPDDTIFGEEFGERAGSSGWRWVLDPIDGTKSFVAGVPLFGNMVGLEDPDGEAVVGAIALPALGDLIFAGRGEGCFWNDDRARVSDVSELSESVALFTGPECFEMTGTEEAWTRVRGAVRFVRGWGDCYGHLLVATGRAEMMLDPILEDWDSVPLLPIVEEAGGRFTSWSGERTARGKSGVSTNAAIADAVRSLIAGS
ncbi:MAG: inositol monophosphatase family protein [Planctomycetota bacterium]